MATVFSKESRWEFWSPIWQACGGGSIMLRVCFINSGTGTSYNLSGLVNEQELFQIL